MQSPFSIVPVVVAPIGGAGRLARNFRDISRRNSAIEISPTVPIITGEQFETDDSAKRSLSRQGESQLAAPVWHPGPKPGAVRCVLYVTSRPHNYSVGSAVLDVFRGARPRNSSGFDRLLGNETALTIFLKMHLLIKFLLTVTADGTMMGNNSRRAVCRPPKNATSLGGMNDAQFT